MYNRTKDFSATATGVLFTIEYGALDTGASVQISSAGVATVSYEASNDNVNWVAMTGALIGASGTTASTSTATGIWVFPAQSRYFRARVSAYTSGTVAGVCVTGKGNDL